MPSIAPVDRRHVQLAHRDELVLGLVLERHGAFHRQVRRVDLQDEAGLVDRQVLVAQLARERHQVGLVRVVVGIHHRGRDDAGRRRGREAFGEPGPCLREALLEARDLLFDRAGVEIAHFADRLRRVGDLARPREAPLEHLDQLRHFLEILADLAFGCAAEARHALRDIGLEADALLLAVVADVDAGRDLARDGVAHGAVHLLGERSCVDRLAGLPPDQQVGERGVARQAADVGRQDAVVAQDHALIPRVRGGWLGL